MKRERQERAISKKTKFNPLEKFFLQREVTKNNSN